MDRCCSNTTDSNLVLLILLNLPFRKHQFIPTNLSILIIFFVFTKLTWPILDVLYVDPTHPPYPQVTNLFLNFSLIKSALQFNPLEFMRPSNNQQYCNRCLKITIGSNRSCKKKNTCSATTITHYSVSNALKYRTKLEDKKNAQKILRNFYFFFYAVNSL